MSSFLILAVLVQSVLGFAPSDSKHFFREKNVGLWDKKSNDNDTGVSAPAIAITEATASAAAVEESFVKAASLTATTTSESRTARVPSSEEVQEKLEALSAQIGEEAKEFVACLSIASASLLLSKVEATEIVECCDLLDHLQTITASTNSDNNEGKLVVTGQKLLNLRQRALEFKRYTMLAKFLQQDYDSYVATASFLSPSRIPRSELPNVQDVPYDKKLAEAMMKAEKDASSLDKNGRPLVSDCTLDDMQYKDSPLDKLLLGIFRKLVTKHTNGVTSPKAGIEGLLEQGRSFMLQPGQTPEAQHKMVYNTLKSLMTPVLPPFYRIFMTGIVPKELGTPWDGKQLGPWFYAPFLTSFVTPVFFAFLVGPSRPNYRKDGALGGLVVEKCKFLQESGCKGLCLHQCKLPAQQFFQDELGLALTVSPNFVSQECQWSFGEVPLSPAQDPSFPDGCLSGCSSRQVLAESVSKSEASKADLCGYPV
mmetsp:Transcript_20900/g.27003  ORF Transcript_20900/g.27003 Transcript_20900/m.27003 type:complete len:481 (-) Transcript_20900:89-1531(-)|eukprot:CAMPEP_0198142796 /NCGR_PEP_ID=MMETSP1443-20131203/5484_1 /TAXON_ID=186043 /ORGANISM="Entomoneis sp., Strain CCMP2396" /LENGTH=480 /DNA_ID=CAMNT_0043805891 /DNA_START=67 /DNA_END=1509 /DNA_ORIENTATION=-